MSRRSLADADFSAPRKSGSDATFPMYVLPVSKVLSMERLPTHERAREEGQLVEWTPGMHAVFVSQTWLSYSHPDNAKNDKLRLLQTFLQDAGKRDIAPHPVSALSFPESDLRVKAKDVGALQYVWFDVFSVPQGDTVGQGKAIASIPSYVWRSSLFLVLAGAWTHEDNQTIRDARTWASRGWCRVENLCNALGPQPKPVVVMRSPSDLKSNGNGGLYSREWHQNPIGLGEFTVESDRAALGPVIEAMIDERMAAKRAEGTEDAMRWYRMLHVMKSNMLHGTGVTSAGQHLHPEEWLAKLGYKTPFESDRCGFTPLTWAVIDEGRADVVKWLLDAGAWKAQGPFKDWSVFGGAEGHTPLDTAAANYKPTSNAEVLQLLISAGANPLERHTKLKAVSLTYACVGGNAANVEALLTASPLACDVRMKTGSRPLTNLARFGHKVALGWCLAHVDPKYFTDALTGSPMGWVALACADIGDLDVISMLLDHGCDPNYFDTAQANKPMKTILKASRMMVRVSKRPSLLFELFSVGCGPALHVAAYAGHLGAVRLLLKRGADVASSNHQLKMTPLHVAAVAGHREVCQLLLEAGAPAGARDSRSRTPATWAKRRGHHEVAQLVAVQPPKHKSPSTTMLFSEETEPVVV